MPCFLGFFFSPICGSGVLGAEFNVDRESPWQGVDAEQKPNPTHFLLASRKPGPTQVRAHCLGVPSNFLAAEATKEQYSG